MQPWSGELLAAQTALFAPQHIGWLGADSAASVVLNRTHLMWLWGDTLLGSSTSHRRRINHFVHGTIALQERTLDAQRNAPSFYVRSLPGATETPDPDGFFQPGGNSSAHGGVYYWMVNAATLAVAGEDDHAWPTLLLAQAMSPVGMLRQLGTDVVLLYPDPSLPPAHWSYTTSRIPQSSPDISFNTGVLLEPDGYVYMLGGRTSRPFGPTVQQLLARIPRAALTRYEWNAMHFWGAGVGWVSQVDRATAIFDGGYTEGSFGHLGLAYYFVGLQAFSPTILLYTAERLTGPWVSQPLYELPPLPTNATIAYAAKTHPALRELVVDRAQANGIDGAGSAMSGSTGGREDAALLVTYNTNDASGEWSSLKSSMLTHACLLA